MSQAKLREALAGGGSSSKEKGPPVADGTLIVTPDTAEAVEWRSRQSVIDAITSSSTYLDDESEGGQHPATLYGKFTWKLENFSEISKRELRSGVFEIGAYKWYILVYPRGCDVANHLSLFLCVADYDKLLPGWGHFAQFTIAVVNKDPKRSKYSDTLHRFCKKEHDWGWKKFMELGKIADGFVVADSLVIKAQVQVITDRPTRPFRTLDPQYRRELTRIYLINVESIVRRFLEEQMASLRRLLTPTHGFLEFWTELPEQERAKMATFPAAPMLKSLVKKFFNEKEVTSTLVMDALYCGVKAIELAHHRSSDRSSPLMPHSIDWDSLVPALPSTPGVVLDAVTGHFVFSGDAVEVLQRLIAEPLPVAGPDKINDPPALRSGPVADDSTSRDSVEREERRLAELGRRAAEIFVARCIFESKLESAWIEAETIKRQDLLILEEEQASKGVAERQAAKAEAEKEKRARKKERQRQKREEERLKKESQEAEKQKAEAERKAEVDRKHREAEERRRIEETEKEAERLRQAAARQQAEGARRQAEAAAKGSSAVRATSSKSEINQTQDHAVHHDSAAASESSNDDASSAANSARSDRSGSGPIQGASVGRASTPAVIVNDFMMPSSSAALSASAATVETSCYPENQSTLVDTLKAHIGRLTVALSERDAEVDVLRVRVADLEDQLSSFNGVASQAQQFASRSGGSAMCHPCTVSGAGSDGNSDSLAASKLNLGTAEVPLSKGHGVISLSPGTFTAPRRVPHYAAPSSPVPPSNASDAMRATASMIPSTLPHQSSSSSSSSSTGNGASRPSSAPGSHVPVGVSTGANSARAPRFAAVAGPSTFSSQQPMSHNSNHNKTSSLGGGGGGGGGGGSKQHRVGMEYQPEHAISNGGGGGGGATGPNIQMQYPTSRSSARPSGMPDLSQQVGSARAYSPLPNTKTAGDSMGKLESPGLDDFAHMGLINDLLE